ncbi:hypothetical protein [Actinokineospora iranica]|uniref:HSP18 transcriptional regulator n=1 Tax=Actinokineospora iranica TaxID=1271860 RepID=A0A1G6KLN8_9PSEU|nr:hypothetical protein [Actinokineospora iranica]SDC31748.1 hypothetical protein SAMN05216174_101974 [Actinokineospora iranica]
MAGNERGAARSRLRGHAPGSAEDAVGDLARVHAVTSGGDTDTAEVLAALSLLRHIREDLAEWEPRLIAAARAAGASWAQLAPALGVASRQAAERRYLRLRPDGDGTTTGEQRVRAERERRAGDRAVVRWARDNSLHLRQLAAAVSALDGLAAEAGGPVRQVAQALGQDDTAALLAPLADAGPHLAGTHPDLAAKITAVTAHTNRVRRNPPPR